MTAAKAKDWYNRQPGEPSQQYISPLDAQKAIDQIYEDMSGVSGGIIQGEGVPIEEDGKLGDYYIDSTDRTILYGPKVIADGPVIPPPDTLIHGQKPFHGPEGEEGGVIPPGLLFPEDYPIRLGNEIEFLASGKVKALRYYRVLEVPPEITSTTFQVWREGADQPLLTLSTQDETPEGWQVIELTQQQEFIVAAHEKVRIVMDIMNRPITIMSPMQQMWPGMGETGVTTHGCMYAYRFAASLPTNGLDINGNPPIEWIDGQPPVDWVPEYGPPIVGSVNGPKTIMGNITFLDVRFDADYESIVFNPIRTMELDYRALYEYFSEDIHLDHTYGYELQFTTPGRIKSLRYFAPLEAPRPDMTIRIWDENEVEQRSATVSVNNEGQEFVGNTSTTPEGTIPASAFSPDNIAGTVFDTYGSWVTALRYYRSATTDPSVTQTTLRLWLPDINDNFQEVYSVTTTNESVSQWYEIPVTPAIYVPTGVALTMDVQSGHEIAYTTLQPADGPTYSTEGFSGNIDLPTYFPGQYFFLDLKIVPIYEQFSWITLPLSQELAVDSGDIIRLTIDVPADVPIASGFVMRDIKRGIRRIVGGPSYITQDGFGYPKVPMRLTAMAEGPSPGVYPLIDLVFHVDEDPWPIALTTLTRRDVFNMIITTIGTIGSGEYYQGMPFWYYLMKMGG